MNSILDNLLKQGFRRLIAGEISKSSIRQLPDQSFQSLEELELSEILLDRLVIEPDVEDRLADSLELCYREGNGIAQIHIFDGETDSEAARSLRFTERFECQYCNIAYRSLDPRLFSFNNPYGACPTCQGFGNTITLDPELIIPDPAKTLGEGAIEPFTKPRYRRFQKKLEAYAQEQKIPLDQPFAQLPDRVRRKIWDGEGNFPRCEGLLCLSGEEEIQDVSSHFC